MVTYSGIYWLTLIDTYGASGMALCFVVFFEVVGLAWGFGKFHFNQKKIKKFRSASNPKGHKGNVGLLPASMLPIPLEIRGSISHTGMQYHSFIFTNFQALFVCCVSFKPLDYQGKVYPLWAQVFGHFLSACSMVVIPGYAVYYMYTKGDDETFKEVGVEV